MVRLAMQNIKVINLKRHVDYMSINFAENWRNNFYALDKSLMAKVTKLPIVRFRM
ncbi:hypothetical protein MTR_7g039760 [Medicago truncatula]|uniref:Uncharacterized protein n=1 Tax=Medicago truncatula TaxID=3880 RepID=A0A072U927_MEDTR|nr:hypothetical protein MTR_7g039760 [Medicago truncatula]